MTISIASMNLIMSATKGDTNARMFLINQSEGKLKSKPLAYVIGFFLGCLGMHRFYAGQIWQPILQIVLCLCAVGFIWVLLDVFLTSGLIDEVNDKIVQEQVMQWQMTKVDE